MKRILYLFSSDLERNAAFPGGAPNGVLTGVAGVGPVDAGIGTTRLLHAERPEAVVFLGTCGAFRTSELVIGDIVTVSSACLCSGDAARFEMRIPSLLPTEVSCDRDLGIEIAARIETLTGRDVSVAIASCTLGITENDRLAELMAETYHGDVENLEAFAVVRAAKEIPAAVILGVTNFVGADGGRDWQLNYQSVMLRLASCCL